MPDIAQLGGQYAKVVNQLAASSGGLTGLVDLHTHPAADVGFGGNLFYGSAHGDPSRTFVDCRSCHAENPFRTFLVNELENTEFSSGSSDHGRGWPDFPEWPSWHDRLHQQLRVEMLQRAWQGGLRVIVAHAVNSHMLAWVGATEGPYDDKSAGDLQIAAIKEMVARQPLVAGEPFMALAFSPDDVRAIVNRGQLAVILGVELDCIGNFYQPSTSNGQITKAAFNPAPSDDAIRAEVSRLHDLGVRYVFPVHVTDNIFGGAALYEMMFDLANRFQFGSFYAPETAKSDPPCSIGFSIDQGTFWKFILNSDDILKLVEPLMAVAPPVGPPPPHRNSRGLQHAGQTLLDALMGLGMMIDVDHMSEKTVQDTLAHTRAARYPVFAGHCGVRLDGGNERSHHIREAQEILDRGGMWGIGIKGGVGGVWDTMALLRNRSQGGGLAFGSDCSGLEQLPAPRAGGPGVADPIGSPQAAETLRTVVYRDLPGAPADALERSVLGSRHDGIYWTGFAHVGMYPDFLEDGLVSGALTAQDLTELFQGPEALAQAWDSCIAATQAPAGPEEGLGTTPVPDPGGPGDVIAPLQVGHRIHTQT